MREWKNIQRKLGSYRCRDKTLIINQIKYKTLIEYYDYLEKLYNSNKPFIIYKVEGGYDLFTDFSEKIVLNNKNINNFFHKICFIKVIITRKKVKVLIIIKF